MTDKRPNSWKTLSRRPIGWVAFFSSFILPPSSFVLADSIFVRTLETQGVTIKELKGEMLVYEVSGRTNERQISTITKLVVTGEAPLNTAEEAFSGERWDQAVDGYQRAMRTSSKQWVKDWSAARLVLAAGKSNRFDAAATAYIAMLMKNPAGASEVKPTMPDSRSTFLNTAITEINTNLADPKTTVEQKRALIGFLIELQQAKRDTAGEEAAYEQLMRLPGGDTNDPNARRLLVRRRLTTAQRALEAKNYRQATAEIDSNRALFTDPVHQVEALWILAEARFAQAGTEPAALKDAALAYMRVVPVAKELPGKPHVVDALTKTASILEQLGERQNAAQLYQEIVSQYPDDPSTARARDGMNRLK